MVEDEQIIAADEDLPLASLANEEMVDVRVERILEHVDESLKLEDALQAAVGAASGDLFLMQYRVRQALEETLQCTPDSVTAIAEVVPVIATFLKLSQQADRYVQLAIKIKTAKDKS